MPINVGDAVLSLRLDTKGFQSGLAGAKSQLQKFGAASRAAGLALTAGGASIVAGLAIAVKSAASFEQAITNTAVVTGKTGDALEKAKGQLDDLASTLGRTTVFTANQAADALGILARKGFDVANSSVKNLQPFLDLAAATMADLTFTTDIATSTLKAFGLEQDQVGRIADVFVKAANTSALNMQTLGEAMKFAAPIARAAGVTFEETAAALGELADKGIVGSIAGTGLRRAFVTLLAPSGKFAETLKKIGLTTADVDLKASSFVKVLATLKEAGFTTAQAMESFGDRGGIIIEQLAELSEKGTAATESLSKFTTTLQNAAGTAATTAKEQLNTLSGQWTLLKSAIESVAINIGKTLIPVLTDFTKRAAIMLQNLSKWIKNNVTLVASITKFVGVLGLMASAIGPILLALPLFVAGIASLGAVFSPVGLAIIGAVTAIGAAIGAAIIAWREFSTLFPKDAIQFTTDMVKMKDAIQTNIVVWIDKAVTAWSKLMKTITTNETFRENLKAFWKSVSTFAQESFNFIQEQFLDFQSAWELGWNENLSVVDAVTSVMGTVWDKAWEGYKATFKVVWDTILDVIVLTWNQTIEGLKDGWNRLFDFIIFELPVFWATKFAPKMLKLWGGLLGNMVQMVKDIDFGKLIRDQIPSALGFFLNRVTTPGVLFNAAKDLIGSPEPTILLNTAKKLQDDPNFRSGSGFAANQSGGGSTTINISINGARFDSEESLVNKVVKSILQLQRDNQFNEGAQA